MVGNLRNPDEMYMFGLDYLISPYSSEAFLADYYGKKALLFKGSADKFTDLFGWEDVNYLIPYTSWNNRSALMVMDKNALDPSQFDRLGYWINKGATYVINHLQTKDPIIDDFARSLSAELNTTVNINCYISAESKQGFDTHYDRHDVFIVQTAGKKTWKVFEPTVKYPQEYMHVPKGKPPEVEPYIDSELSPGDVLYIPRGHWHHAVAKESTIHLTVGIDARTGIDFLRWLLNKELWENEFLRKNFPIAFSATFAGRRPQIELQTAFDQFREHLTRKINADDFFEIFKEFVMTENPMGPQVKVTFPNQILLKDRITEDTEFELPKGQKILLEYDKKTKTPTIMSRGLVIDLEGVNLDVLEVIFNEKPPRPISIRGTLDACPEAKEESVRKLLLQLVARGVIKLRTQESGDV